MMPYFKLKVVSVQSVEKLRQKRANARTLLQNWQWIIATEQE